MPYVPVPSTVMAELRMTLDGQKIENTLYFLSASGPSLANMEVLGSDLEGWWTTNCAPLLPVDVLLRELVITDLTTNTGPQYTDAPEGGIPGVIGQPALPNNVSLAISFRTALRGRSFRGRNYIPALTENQVVNNTVSAAVAASWVSAYNELIAILATGAREYTWVVVSRFSGVDADKKPIPRTIGLKEPVVTALVVDATVDSMRRRLPGRGR
jgi:hypothetical protein